MKFLNDLKVKSNVVQAFGANPKVAKIFFNAFNPKKSKKIRQQ